jgi:hypothetical protein
MAKPPRMTLPKPKPATKPAPNMSTSAVLGRAERIQREEAGESALMRRRPAKDVISVVTRMRETPVKKGR